MVGCGTAAAYPVPGTTRWYVCGSTPPHFSRRTPPGSRTPYPLIKSQVLWPDELEAHIRLCRSGCQSTATQTEPRVSGLLARTLEDWAHGGAQSTVHTSAGSSVNRLVWLTGQILPMGVPGAEAADSPILLAGRCITQFGVLKVLAGERVTRPACGYEPGDIPVRAENDGATDSATCKG